MASRVRITEDVRKLSGKVHIAASGYKVQVVQPGTTTAVTVYQAATGGATHSWFGTDATGMIVPFNADPSTTGTAVAGGEMWAEKQAVELRVLTLANVEVTRERLELVSAADAVSVESDVDSEVTARTTALADHVSAIDPHGDRFIGSLMSRGIYPGALGYHSGDSCSWGTRTGGPTLSRLVLSPLYAAEDMVLRDWIVNLASGAVATAVYRLGVYQIDDQSHPMKHTVASQWATLLNDLGTVDFSTTGIKTISTAVTIPKGTWFAVGAAAQVALSTGITVGQNVGGVSGPLGSTGNAGSAPSVAAAACGLYMDSVTGALPSGFVVSGRSNIGHGVGFNRSA